MLYVAYVLLGAIVVTGALTAILSRNLIRAAVALGTGSVALAMLFFILRAPYAGGFELSVGAGLISVLFIVAISLTESMGREHDEPNETFDDWLAPYSQRRVFLLHNRHPRRIRAI